MSKLINISVVGLCQVGNYLLNELNTKKKDIELKTGKKINVVAVSARNINKKRKSKVNKKIFYKTPLKIFEKNNISQTKVLKTITNFYKNESFVKILKPDSLLSTNDVINTNNCDISVCKSKYSNKIIILSAIDKLIKGRAGQAVQNLNNKFNFPEKTGLI